MAEFLKVHGYTGVDRLRYGIEKDVHEDVNAILPTPLFAVMDVREPGYYVVESVEGEIINEENQ